MKKVIIVLSLAIIGLIGFMSYETVTNSSFNLKTHKGREGAENISHAKTFNQIFRCIDPKYQRCFVTAVEKREKELGKEEREKFEALYREEFDHFENEEKAYEKAHGGEIQTPDEYHQWLEQHGYLTGETKEIWSCYLEAYTECHGPALATQQQEKTAIVASSYNNNKNKISHDKTFNQIFRCIDPRYQRCFVTAVEKREKELGKEEREQFEALYRKEFNHFQDEEKAYEKAHGGEIQTPDEYHAWLENNGYLTGDTKEIWSCYLEAYTECHGPALEQVEKTVSAAVVPISYKNKKSHDKTFNQIFRCIDPRYQRCFVTAVEKREKELGKEEREQFEAIYRKEFDHFQNEEKAYEKAHGGEIQTPDEYHAWLDHNGYLTGDTKEIWSCYLEAYTECHGPALTEKTPVEAPVVSYKNNNENKNKISHDKTFNQIFRCIDPKYQRCFVTAVEKKEKELGKEERKQFEALYRKEFDHFQNEEKAYEKAHGGEIQTPDEYHAWLDHNGYLTGETKEIWSCYLEAYTECHGPVVFDFQVKLPPGYFDCIGQQVPICQKDYQQYLGTLSDEQADEVADQFQERLDAVWTQMENLYNQKKAMPCSAELQKFVDAQGWNESYVQSYFQCWLPAYQECALNPKC